MAACCAVAVGSLVTWALLWSEAPAGVVAAGAAMSGLGGAWLSRWYAPPPCGLLVWDGRQWSWNSVPGDVAVVMDLGPWLLLHFVPGRWSRGGHVWLPLSRRCAGGAWHGLRAAVYSRRPEPRTPSAPRM